MELLLCPFCGSNDLIYVDESDTVNCGKCCIWIYRSTWNTRHSPTKEWCPFATMELSKCQKAFNELQIKYNNLLKNINSTSTQETE